VPFQLRQELVPALLTAVLVVNFGENPTFSELHTSSFPLPRVAEAAPRITGSAVPINVEADRVY
jgi:hypothetical protein